jgi:hypothetical protein
MFSPPIAARLLSMAPGPVFTFHVAEHPGLFANSTPRRFARVDIESHPRRQGRPVTAREFLEHECAMAIDRAAWRRVNATRADRVHTDQDTMHRLDIQARLGAAFDVVL